MNENRHPELDGTIEQVVDIVAAYVSHNSLRPSDLPDLINAVHASLQQLTRTTQSTTVQDSPAPAVTVKKSLHRDYIICLEDGKRFKSLRRHLNSFHHLSPDQYRAKWGLPSDYPMVAPAYSATRSRLAKDSGLGQVARNGAEAAEPETRAAKVDGEKPKRGRPRKQAD